MRQSQGKTLNRKNSRILLNKRRVYVIIPHRFEAAACSASLPGKVKSFILLHALRLRARSKDNEAAMKLELQLRNKLEFVS